MKLKSFLTGILTSLFKRSVCPTKLRLHKYLSHSQKDRFRPRLIEKYGMRCFWCGDSLKRETITIDHYIPLSKGGSNKIENLRIACQNCNGKRGNAMPDETLKILNTGKLLRIPSHWESPKYRLGQQMKQGQIVGVEYHPPATKRASVFGENWTYWVLLDEQDVDLESFKEQNLEPLSAEDLLSEIEYRKSLVKIHQRNLNALEGQLKEVGQVINQ